MANQSKTIWLLSSNGHKLQCHVNTDEPLAALLKQKYAQALGVSSESLILVFDGEKIREEDTFDSLAMEDHDIVDVLEGT
ncbi:small ubiquitin-related modifier [Drosophila teissieri]|uniref:small ubiquitin-related modifier n=1 Tax=Drosophila teissieri TaxID=7243 RepID=UPI001CB9FAE2|nr:small ubiquitin-related modifier [Drosophila teissieri]